MGGSGIENLEDTEQNYLLYDEHLLLLPQCCSIPIPSTRSCFFHPHDADYSLVSWLASVL